MFPNDQFRQICDRRRADSRQEISGVVEDDTGSCAFQLRPRDSTAEHPDDGHCGAHTGFHVPHRIADEHGARRRHARSGITSPVPFLDTTLELWNKVVGRRGHRESGARLLNGAQLRRFR